MLHILFLRISPQISKIADFVTFIEDGRIVISDEKDAILDKLRLFKVENSCSIAGLSERLTGVKGANSVSAA